MGRLVLFFIACAVIFFLLNTTFSIFGLLAKISLVMAGITFLVFLFKKMFFSSPFNNFQNSNKFTN